MKCQKQSFVLMGRFMISFWLLTCLHSVNCTPIYSRSDNDPTAASNNKATTLDGQNVTAGLGSSADVNGREPTIHAIYFISSISASLELTLLKRRPVDNELLTKCMKEAFTEAIMQAYVGAKPPKNFSQTCPASQSESPTTSSSTSPSNASDVSAQSGLSFFFTNVDMTWSQIANLMLGFMDYFDVSHQYLAIEVANIKDMQSGNLRGKAYMLDTKNDASGGDMGGDTDAGRPNVVPSNITTSR